MRQSDTVLISYRFDPNGSVFEPVQAYGHYPKIVLSWSRTMPSPGVLQDDLAPIASVLADDAWACTHLLAHFETFAHTYIRRSVRMRRTMHDTFMSLLTAADCRGEQESPDAEKKAHWHAPGDYKVWLPQGLVVVEVPEYGDAIMKTVIAADALIGPNRDLWETLGKSGIKAERFVRRQGPDWFELHAESPLADDVVDSAKLCA